MTTNNDNFGAVEVGVGFEVGNNSKVLVTVKYILEQALTVPSSSFAMAVALTSIE